LETAPPHPRTVSRQRRTPGAADRGQRACEESGFSRKIGHDRIS
jgi:hypothetical protein